MWKSKCGATIFLVNADVSISLCILADVILKTRSQVLTVQKLITRDCNFVESFSLTQDMIPENQKCWVLLSPSWQISCVSSGKLYSFYLPLFTYQWNGFNILYLPSQAHCQTQLVFVILFKLCKRSCVLEQNSNLNCLTQPFSYGKCKSLGNIILMLKRGERVRRKQPEPQVCCKAQGWAGPPQLDWHFGGEEALGEGVQENAESRSCPFIHQARKHIWFGVVGNISLPLILKMVSFKTGMPWVLGFGNAGMTNARLCSAFPLHIAKIHIPHCPGFRPCNHSFESAVLFSALSSFYSHQK